MITPELVSFIKKEIALGKTTEQIKLELLSTGWIQSDIEDGFKDIDNPVATPTTNKILPGPNNKLTYFVLLFVLLGLSGSAYFFRSDLNSLLSNSDTGKESNNIALEDKIIIAENSATEESKLGSAEIKKEVEAVPATTLKPYEIRFVSPANGTEVQLGEMLSVKVQVGEKIKKVRVDNISYFYNPTGSPHSGIKPFEIPVEGGYANFSSRIDGTLSPITFYLEGIADDVLAYIEAENNLTQAEAFNMFLEIKPFTNQPIDSFSLEDEDKRVTYLYYPTEEYRVPQFIAGFPVHGIVAVSSRDVEFVVSDPTIISIVKDPSGPVVVKGLKNGSTKAIAKYKGKSQEIFFNVGYTSQ